MWSPEKFDSCELSGRQRAGSQVGCQCLAYWKIEIAVSCALMKLAGRCGELMTCIWRILTPSLSPSGIPSPLPPYAIKLTSILQLKVWEIGLGQRATFIHNALFGF